MGSNSNLTELLSKIFDPNLKLILREKHRDFASIRKISEARHKHSHYRFIKFLIAQINETYYGKF